MNAEQIHCGFCGGPLAPRVEERTAGLHCPACDRWIVVTPCSPPIFQDSTRYEVFIAAGDHRNRHHIRAVAELLGINYLAARTLLLKNSAEVFAGRAFRVVPVRDRLIEAGLSLRIEPPFPW